MEKKDGGPAFGHGDPTHGGHPGMSRRDYFAANAMQGVLGNMRLLEGLELTASSRQMPTSALAAAMAYDIADAMLKVSEG